MGNIWEEFDDSVDLEGLQKDIEEASSNTNSGDFKEVPVGEYEISIEELELVKSKKGDPMLKVWMKIVEGEYKNSLLFYNQIVPQAFQIHIANEFLRGLGGEEVEFKSYSQYAQLIDRLKVYCDDHEFKVNYTKKKDIYDSYEITDIYDLD